MNRMYAIGARGIDLDQTPPEFDPISNCTESGTAHLRATRCSLDCLRNHGPETQDGETEEQRPDDGDREELRPHHIQPGTTIQNRLREGDEVCRWRDLHKAGEPRRHALKLLLQP